MSNCNCGTPRAPGASRALDLSKFGRCRFCIYSSLLLALAGWSAYVPIMFEERLKLVAYGVMAIALFATILFGIHIGVIIVGRVARS